MPDYLALETSGHLLLEDGVSGLLLEVQPAPVDCIIPIPSTPILCGEMLCGTFVCGGVHSGDIYTEYALELRADPATLALDAALVLDAAGYLDLVADPAALSLGASLILDDSAALELDGVVALLNPLLQPDSCTDLSLVELDCLDLALAESASIDLELEPALPI